MGTKQLIKILLGLMVFTIVVGIIGSIKSSVQSKKWLFYITVENKCNVNKAYFYDGIVTIRDEKHEIHRNTLSSIKMSDIEDYIKNYENKSDEVYKIVFKDESVYYVDKNDEYINNVFTILNYNEIFNCE